MAVLNLANEGKCEKIVLSKDMELTKSITLAGELDLNQKLLTMTGSTTVTPGKTATISNGSIEAKVSGTTSSAIVIEAGGTLTVDNVTLNTNGAGIFPEGDATKVVVKNSFVSGWSYGIGTNASENHTLEMVLENSTFKAAGAAVFMNVSSNLTVDNCTIIGRTQGMVVRGGTAKVSNSVITLNFDFDTYEDYYNKYENIDWGTGNSVQAAALTMGNKNNSGSTAYRYPTNVTLVNTRVTLTLHKDLFPCVYAYANQGEGLGVTFTYDEQCEFDKDPVYASENITVNGKDVTPNVGE